MKCPKCQFDNEESAKFCGPCSHRLEPICLECGKLIKHGSRFCNACDHRLEDISAKEKPIPQSESEQKYATVLYSGEITRHWDMVQVTTEPEVVKYQMEENDKWLMTREF